MNPEIEASGKSTAMVAACRYSYDGICIALRKHTAVHLDGNRSIGKGTDGTVLGEHIGNVMAGNMPVPGMPSGVP